MSFNRTQSRLVRAVYRSLERGAARRTHRIISVADAMTRQAVDAGLAPAERFVTVRSGMDTAAFGPDAEARRLWRERWDTHPDETVVGTIARLFDNKGYDDLLDAMPAAVAGCPKLRFVWVGDGSRRDEYVRRLRDMGLVDCVVLTGLLRPDEIPSVLNGFDILVHASRWEGLPRAVVQALLTSVPAISYDNDGAPEVVVSGETGVLVPLGDTAGLASAVVDLASDASKRCAMGETGRRRCLEAFSWRRMVSEIESVYGEYLGVPREVPPEG